MYLSKEEAERADERQRLDMLAFYNGDDDAEDDITYYNDDEEMDD